MKCESGHKKVVVKQKCYPSGLESIRTAMLIHRKKVIRKPNDRILIVHDTKNNILKFIFSHKYSENQIKSANLKKIRSWMV